jgi:hypothetical protein
MERTVTRSVTLELTPFGRDSVADEASRQNLPVETLLRHAVLHYLAERDSDRLAPRIPRFLRSTPAGDERVELDVDLDPSEWTAVEAAAEDAGVPLDRVLAHATMLYLADLGAGVVAERLLDPESD